MSQESGSMVLEEGSHGNWPPQPSLLRGILEAAFRRTHFSGELNELLLLLLAWIYQLELVNFYLFKVSRQLKIVLKTPHSSLHQLYLSKEKIMTWANHLILYLYLSILYITNSSHFSMSHNCTLL